MSYYQPFYYPYFSARADLPPSLLQLDRRYADLHDLPLPAEAVLAQQEARKLELDSYARSNYAKAQLERMGEERRIEAEVEAQLELKRETEYLHRIAALRRERDLLEMVRHPEGSARDRYDPQVKEKQATRESYMTDEQLLRHYATGQRFNEYQRDVRDKLGQKHSNPDKQPAITAKLTYSHETENSPAKIEKKANIEHHTRQTERNANGKSYREESSQKEHDRAAQAFKRSYIDELNDSKGHSIEKGNYLKPRGETIDLLPQSQIDMPFLQHRYGPAPKNNKKRRVNQSVSHIPKKKHKQVTLLPSKGNKTFTAATASEAMKKINNRLKVSAIVYKDSKLRNQRHEIDHLFNTFQIEIKGRKQVKERINNNPDILRKHNMVVDK